MKMCKVASRNLETHLHSVFIFFNSRHSMCVMRVERFDSIIRAAAKDRARTTAWDIMTMCENENENGLTLDLTASFTFYFSLLSVGGTCMMMRSAKIRNKKDFSEKMEKK